MAPDKLPYSLLLIDDEADNASINTSGDKKRVTRINEGIRDLLVKFEKSSYIGYTATPLQIFLSIQILKKKWKSKICFPQIILKF